MGSQERDIIANILMEDLFKYQVAHGPQRDYTKSFPKVTYSDIILDGAPNIIPDNIYRPQIMISIDFTHKFVLRERAPSGSDVLEGKRPLDKELLEYCAKKLLNYFSYYFEKTLSYSKNYEYSRLQNIINRARNSDEWGYNVLINEILNFFLTGIQVNRSRNEIGTATISLKDSPMYFSGRGTRLFFDKTYDVLNQLFVPMLPVKIWAKGRIYTDFFFPIFDGFTVASSERNSEGYYSVDLNCKDYLELARNSYEMINPAIMQIEEFRKQENINIYSKPLYNHDHIKIFKALTLGGSLIYNIDDIQNPKIQLSEEVRQQKGTHNFSALGNLIEINEESKESPELLDWKYYKTRVTQGGAPFSVESALELTSHTKTPRGAVSWGYHITPYRLLQFQSVQTYTSEFSNRLDVLKEIAQMVYYELYVDPWGNLQYHPMRFGNEYLYNDIVYMDKLGSEVKHMISFPGTYTIGPEETKSFAKVMNVEELTTHLRLRGVPAFVPNVAGEQVDLVASYYDRKMMQRFGYRRKELTNPLINSRGEIRDKSTGNKEDVLWMAARELMNYLNGELYACQAEIIFRPELQVAMPLLMLPQNEVFYINNLSHSVTIGGDATTSINASFGRKVNIPAIDIASVMIKSEKLYIVNPGEAVSEEDDQSAEIALQDAKSAEALYSDFADGLAQEKAKAAKNRGSKNKTSKSRRTKGETALGNTRNSRSASQRKKQSS